MSDMQTRVAHYDELLGASPPACARRSSTRPTTRSSGATSKGCSPCSRSCTRSQPSVAIGIVGKQLVVADTPMPKASRHGRADQAAEGSQDRARSRSNAASPPTRLAAFIHAVAALGGKRDAGRARLDRSRTSASAASPPRSADRTGSAATWRRSGSSTRTPSRSREGRVGERRRPKGSPTCPPTLQAVDGLAEAVAQNRTALVALTALQNYDNYTFTHMVNVSILTMGQARALGIDGRAAARVRPVGADARHRQGPDAERDPEQARQAHRRRVRDHAAPHGRRRRDPAPHAGDADPRAGRRLRAPPAARRHRLSRRRQARRR